MRKLIIISLLVALGVTVNAQKKYKPFSTDTVQGAETVYFPLGGEITKHSGVVSFSFVKADIADSCSLIRIQGANLSTFTDAVNLTGNAALAYTTTDEATILYEENPKYIFYRLAATCAAGDSVIFTTPVGVYKED